MNGSLKLALVSILYLHKKNDMKYLGMVILAFSLACSNADQANENQVEEQQPIESGLSFFGDTITTDGAMAMSDVVASVNESGSVNAKLQGEIESVCQKKGCWMKMNIEGYDQPVRVTFKDYGFFVPKDGASNWAVIEGIARFDTVSVETLRHYAEDAGKSEEEIMQITEPEYTLAFEASGVAIKEASGEE